MKRIWHALVFLLGGALALQGCQSGNDQVDQSVGSAPTLETIVAHNTEALGGAAALDAVQSMRKRTNIIEKEFDDETVFVVDRAGRMRVDIFADGKRVFAESFDGENGYQWDPDKMQTPASEKGTIALSNTSQLPNHILRLKDMEANGHSLDYLETEAIAGEDYHVLKLTLSNGFETFLYVQSQTGFVTKVRNQRALHVDVDDEIKLIEAQMSDFRETDGIVHPFKVEEFDLARKEILVDITIRSVEVNVDIPDGYFRDLSSIVPEL